MQLNAGKVFATIWILLHQNISTEKAILETKKIRGTHASK